MSYQEKYIKYKSKYINLKYQQSGGGLTWKELLKKWDQEKDVNIKFPDYSFAIKFYPFTGNNLNSEIKYKILRKDKLSDNQDFSSFKNKFKEKCKVVSFKNLSGDSTLIVPCPDVNKNYAHLYLFNLNAKNKKKKLLWKKVSQEINNIIKSDKNKLIYLNTHGFGVPYLHIRIDSKPKYGYDFLINK